MTTPRTTQLRNIALVGHAGAGKTTLVESLLAKVGRIGRAGTVEGGNTVSDYEPEEREHGHSLSSAFVHFEHEGAQITIADTPGAPDMIGQALSVLPAVECVAIVISADRGIQSTTRRMMDIVEARKLPHVIIVNKTDEHVQDLEPLLEEIHHTFGSACMPINLPTPDGEDVIDVWEKSEGASAFSSVAEAHTALVDQCVELDEALMNTYLEQGHLEPEQLHDAFEKALRDAHLVPVCFTSARTGAGLDDLLHIFACLAPNPLEGNPRPFLHRLEDGTEEDWLPDPASDGPTVCHVFKVATDPYVGKLAMLKVHQGSLSSHGFLHLDGVKKPIKLVHLLRLHGKDQERIEEAVAGEIVAVAKIDELHFDGVLHGPTIHDLRFNPLPVPRPMFGVAVTPKRRGDEAKISGALQRIAEEDPTVEIDYDPRTHDAILRTMGEQHMRVLLERLSNRFKVDVETKPPRIAYKETITKAAEGHYRHKKQTGGAGQFGEVFLRVEPLTNGESAERLQFVDETVGGSIPRQFMSAVEKGVWQAMDEGVAAGYPVHGVRVAVYDGKHHAVDSKEVAFIAAGRKAFIDAIQKAGPVLLEPMVEVDVTAPSDVIGDINSDLTTRRGQVLQTDYLADNLVHVHAQAPLAEMQTYSSTLESITHGTGSFEMSYSHDETAPATVQKEQMESFRGDRAS